MLGNKRKGALGKGEGKAQKPAFNQKEKKIFREQEQSEDESIEASKPISSNTVLPSHKSKFIDISSSDSDSDEIQYVREDDNSQELQTILDKPFIEQKRKMFSLSVVIPSSAVDNAQTREIKTYMIGEIARTLAMYRVDEIILYHDNKTDKKDSINHLITNLQYLETPQYLRRTLFPLSESLSNAGLMNPLDASHHLRFDEWCPYREGIVLNRPLKDGSWVNIGLKKDCKIKQKLEEKTRVTVKLDQATFNNQLKFYSGAAVSSNEPKEKLGLYWGYFVRVAESIDEIFSQSTYNEKYDLILGVGENGKDYKDIKAQDIKKFRRCLLFVGGTKGIEYTVDSDEKFNGNSSKIESVFDLYLNTLPDKGCRNIRTEEWLRVSLSSLFPTLLSRQALE